jgi:[protein-PII] uridylyltransferase
MPETKQANQTLHSNLQALRSNLKTQQAVLETSFFQHKNPAQLLKKHAQLIDTLLKQVWLQANIHGEVTLIAVGGYGRGELFPYSDIDLLILLPQQHDYVLNEQIESLIGKFWDIGLNVGHSVRTLDECVSEAAQDVTVQTNLLEARLLAGNKANYQQFVQAINALMRTAEFFAAKFKEQDNRHAKFNDTAYSLEPNIKESPGGLRDLHMILWLAQSQKLGKNWLELAKNNIITATELRQIKQHECNLQTLRIRLHYLARRREDRLLFDYQNELAANLGLVNTPHKRASEQFMQSYYRSV